MAAMIVSSHVDIIITLTGVHAGTRPQQCLSIIPGRPIRRTLLQLRRVPWQLGQIVERIAFVCFSVFRFVDRCGVVAQIPQPTSDPCLFAVLRVQHVQCASPPATPLQRIRDVGI